MIAKMRCSMTSVFWTSSAISRVRAWRMSRFCTLQSITGRSLRRMWPQLNIRQEWWRILLVVATAVRVEWSLVHTIEEHHSMDECAVGLDSIHDHPYWYNVHRRQTKIMNENTMLS